MVILYWLVLTLHIIACLFLIGVVLLQQGKGQDLASAFGGGGSQTAFGPRGSANVLTRATTILAGAFMVTSLSLTVLKPGPKSVLDTLAPVAAPSAAASVAPSAVPVAPAEVPAAPAAPAAPAPTATAAPAQ